MNPLLPPPSPSRKCLLLDDRFVADAWNIRRVQATPIKHPGPVCKPWIDHNWRMISYGSVQFDQSTGKYLLWYTLSNLQGMASQSKARAQGVAALDQWFANAKPTDAVTVTALAISDDGLHFKPHMLTSGPLAGTNVVDTGHSESLASCVMQGLFPNDPSRKFTSYYCQWFSTQLGGHCYTHSPDGIHWTPDPKNPFIFGESDTNNTIIKNPFGPGYFLYERPWDCAAWGWVPGNTRRRVAACHSTDLYNWSEPRNLFYPDEADNYEHYGLAPFYMDGVMFGLLSEYHPTHETMDMHLSFSRDGIRFDRLPDRKRLFERGADTEFDSTMVYVCHNPILVNGDLRMYYVGRPKYHNDITGHDADNEGIGLLTFKHARLIGRRGDHNLGLLLTHPFTLDADHLYIDAQTSPVGSIQAELVVFDPREPGGRTLPGFSRADFDTFTGNNPRHQLTWKGKSIASLKGQTVRLRLGLSHATVWSYQL